jgi:hypothetical protein
MAHASEIIAKGVLDSARRTAARAKGDQIGNYGWASDWTITGSGDFVQVHALVLDFDVFYTLGPFADRRGNIVCTEQFTSNSLTDTSHKLAHALTWQLPKGAAKNGYSNR